MTDGRIPWGVLAVLCVLAGACAGGDGGAAAPQPSVAAPSGAVSPGATPTAPASGVLETAFPSGDLELSGDLYLPEGTGPHPGVVLVHGSGPLDRDGTVPGQLGMTFPEPVTVFADLAGDLRDAGYAVLTYDKRTCGPFNGCSDNDYPQPPAGLTVDAFITDAEAALAHLGSRDEVDGGARAVIGHSQGASFVPAMLIDDPALGAGVMLAAPFDPIDEIVMAQDAAMGRSVRLLRSEDVADDTMIAGASVAFWRSWFRVSDGVPQLATQVTQPLLVVGGELDANVPPAQLDRWEQLLGDGAQVVELDCVSHALNCLATDDMSAIVPADVGPTVASSVGETVIEFLDAAL
jgi:hypothetical protein